MKSGTLSRSIWAHNPWERPDIGLVESWIRVLYLQEGFAGYESEEPRNASIDCKIRTVNSECVLHISYILTLDF